MNKDDANLFLVNEDTTHKNRRKITNQKGEKRFKENLYNTHRTNIRIFVSTFPPIYYNPDFDIPTTEPRLDYYTSNHLSSELTLQCDETSSLVFSELATLADHFHLLDYYYSCFYSFSKYTR